MQYTDRSGCINALEADFVFMGISKSNGSDVMRGVGILHLMKADACRWITSGAGLAFVCAHIDSYCAAEAHYSHRTLDPDFVAVLSHPHDSICLLDACTMNHPVVPPVGASRSAGMAHQHQHHDVAPGRDGLTPSEGASFDGMTLATSRRLAAAVANLAAFISTDPDFASAIKPGADQVTPPLLKSAAVIAAQAVASPTDSLPAGQAGTTKRKERIGVPAVVAEPAPKRRTATVAHVTYPRTAQVLRETGPRGTAETADELIDADGVIDDLPDTPVSGPAARIEPPAAVDEVSDQEGSATTDGTSAAPGAAPLKYAANVVEDEGTFVSPGARPTTGVSGLENAPGTVSEPASEPVLEPFAVTALRAFVERPLPQNDDRPAPAVSWSTEIDSVASSRTVRGSPESIGGADSRHHSGNSDGGEPNPDEPGRADSVTDAGGPGIASMHQGYLPIPPFNRRLETNGVDQRLFLDLAFSSSTHAYSGHDGHGVIQSLTIGAPRMSTDAGSSPSRSRTKDEDNTDSADEPVPSGKVARAATPLIILPPARSPVMRRRRARSVARRKHPAARVPCMTTPTSVFFSLLSDLRHPGVVECAACWVRPDTGRRGVRICIGATVGPYPESTGSAYAGVQVACCARAIFLAARSVRMADSTTGQE